MFDLSESVILPREDFLELQMAAWDSDPTPLGDRIASIVQITMICLGMAGAVAVGTWGWAKQMKELEDKKLATWVARRKANESATPADKL